MLGMWEWARLLQCSQRLSKAYSALFLAVVGAWTFLSHAGYAGQADQTTMMLWVGAPIFLVTLYFWLGIVPYALYRKPVGPIWRLFFLGNGLIIGLANFLAISMISQQGPVFLLSVCLLVWAADIGAYFTGRYWGKRKLAPYLSPGKTWEGVVGGFICVWFIAIFFLLQSKNSIFSLLLAKQGVVGLIVMTTLLFAWSVIGDLFESLLKRQAGVKDSSHLLPGHGGILDRIDALIPVFPMVAALIWCH